MKKNYLSFLVFISVLLPMCAVFVPAKGMESNEFKTLEDYEAEETLEIEGQIDSFIKTHGEEIDQKVKEDLIKQKEKLSKFRQSKRDSEFVKGIISLRSLAQKKLKEGQENVKQQQQLKKQKNESNQNEKPVEQKQKQLLYYKQTEKNPLEEDVDENLYVQKKQSTENTNNNEWVASFIEKRKLENTLWWQKIWRVLYILSGSTFLCMSFFLLLHVVFQIIVAVHTFETVTNNKMVMSVLSKIGVDAQKLADIVTRCETVLRNNTWFNWLQKDKKILLVPFFLELCFGIVFGILSVVTFFKVIKLGRAIKQNNDKLEECKKKIASDYDTVF